jgi:hypothetical protein
MSNYVCRNKEKRLISVPGRHIAISAWLYYSQAGISASRPALKGPGRHIGRLAGIQAAGPKLQRPSRVQLPSRHIHVLGRLPGVPAGLPPFPWLGRDCFWAASGLSSHRSVGRHSGRSIAWRWFPRSRRDRAPVPATSSHARPGQPFSLSIGIPSTCATPPCQVDTLDASWMPVPEDYDHMAAVPWYQRQDKLIRLKQTTIDK